MLFQPFQPGWRLFKNVDQPNQPKTVFPQKNTKKPNHKEMVDPSQAFYNLLFFQ